MGRTYQRKRAFQDIAQSVGALQPYGLGRVVHRGFQEAALRVGGSVAARPRRVATRLQHRANSSGGLQENGKEAHRTDREAPNGVFVKKPESKVNKADRGGK